MHVRGCVFNVYYGERARARECIPVDLSVLGTSPKAGDKLPQFLGLCVRANDNFSVLLIYHVTFRYKWFPAVYRSVQGLAETHKKNVGAAYERYVLE